MKKTLLNPFEKYNEAQLLTFGVIALVLCAYLGYFFEIRFDNILHLSTAKNITFLQSLLENAVNLLCVFVFLYPLGLIINKKTRFIDILNTVVVARSLCCLMVLCTRAFDMAGINETIINNSTNPYDIQFTPVQLAIILILAFLLIGILIWHIALLYNGFKTATNLKSVRDKILFAVAILLADILSMILIPLLN